MALRKNARVGALGKRLGKSREKDMGKAL